MTPATLLLVLGAALAQDSVPTSGPRAPLTRAAPAGASLSRDTTGEGAQPRRPRAVELSDGYARRLTVHRWGSYTMVPLFAAQYLLGDRLLDQKTALFAGTRTERVDAGVRNTHRAVAIGVGALFAVNTVTGVWNWYESRGVEEKRGLRTAHALLMLAADAGFVATGIAGGRAVDRDVDAARDHRRLGLSSMGVAAASAAMMAIFNRD